MFEVKEETRMQNRQTNKFKSLEESNQNVTMYILIITGICAGYKKTLTCVEKALFFLLDTGFM